MTGEPRIPCGHAALPASAHANDAIAHIADKASLRAALKAARRARDPVEKARLDALIGARVLAWWHAHGAGEGGAGADPGLGVYWPLRGEPDLQPLYAELARAGVRLALPLVVAPDCPLAFVAWVPGEPMASDRMGVAVPALQRLVDRPGVLLVPCLGFTQERFRLGYGGGYYDRTLEKEPRPVTVGIAYSGDQVAFAAGPHDVPLDWVIAEG